MALTDQDKKWIKGAIVEGVNEALEVLVIPRFDVIDGRLDRLESDVATLKKDVADIKSKLHEINMKLASHDETLGSIESELDALRSDILKIYNSIYKKPSKSFVSASFDKLSNKDKLLVMQEQLQKLAKETGVTLSNIKTV